MACLSIEALGIESIYEGEYMKQPSGLQSLVSGVFAMAILSCLYKLALCCFWWLVKKDRSCKICHLLKGEHL